MSPFRWPVLITGFVLAVPVLALGIRGDLSSDQVAVRVLWCLGAGWIAVLLVQWASTPPRPTAPPAQHPEDPVAPAEPAGDQPFG